MPSLTKKAVTIFVYAIVLSIVWIIIKKNLISSKEGFDVISDTSNRQKAYFESASKSFDKTYLRNLPEVNKIAQSYPTLPSFAISSFIGKIQKPPGQKSKFTSTGDIVKALGTTLRSSPTVNKLARQYPLLGATRKFKAFTNTIELPKELDPRVVWKGYLSAVTSQGDCGNCWAHACSTVLADRFALLSLGQVKFNPSPFDLTICAHQFNRNNPIEKEWGNIPLLEQMDNYIHGKKIDPKADPNDQTKGISSAACGGSTLYYAADILFNDGVTDVSCFPDKGNVGNVSYNVSDTTSDKPENLPFCHPLQTPDFDTCIDQKTAMRKYRAKTIYNLGDPDKDSLDQLEKIIMYDMYRHGPIVSGFMVFNDFMDPSKYDGTTIYDHPDPTSEFQGGHAIALIGWGEEIVKGKVIPFWWVRNSWGSEWAINGLFRVKRKMDQGKSLTDPTRCDFERNAIGFLPNFSGMTFDPKVITPTETPDRLVVQNFSKHFVDLETGYFTSALEKIRQCKLRGDVKPYIHPDVVLPDYGKFWAGLINEYLEENPIPNLKPIPEFIFCNGPPIEEAIQNMKKMRAVSQPNSSLTNKENTNMTSPSVLDFNAKIDIPYFVLLVGGCVLIWIYVGNDPE